MRLIKGGIAAVALIGLTACQTANGMRVNGIDLGPHPAQGGQTFCERNVVLCLAGGAAMAGGVAFAAMGHKSGMGAAGGY